MQIIQNKNDDIYCQDRGIIENKRNTLNHNVIKLFIITIFTFLIQATTVTIFGVKLIELFGLVSIFILLFLRKKIKIEFLYFLLYFLFLLMTTFLIDLHTTFYIPNSNLSIVKKPYMITIARVLELISCISISLIVYLYLKKNKEKYKYIIDTFFYINMLFAFFFIFMYILDVYGLFENTFIYNTNRLKGLFVEGGPFGLYYAFLIVISFILHSKLLYRIIYLSIILLAQSKAGFAYLLLFFLFYYFLFKIKSVKFKIIGLFLAFILGISAVFYIGTNYIHDIENIDTKLVTNASSNSLVMGRIAAVFIGPNMLKDKYFFGVGLGNYSLVRNNPLYLGLFPPTEYWDLTGLGIFTLLLENGLIGFLLFNLLLYYLLKKYGNNRTNKLLLFSFFLIFYLGVQVYFIYPWIVLGVIFFLSYIEGLNVKTNNNN